MSARAESLAKQFEAKAAEMTAIVAKLSDADWKKITSAEKWPVGVTAHHLARGHEGILGIVKTIAAGKFKDVCLQTLDEVAASRRPVVISTGSPIR